MAQKGNLWLSSDDDEPHLKLPLKRPRPNPETCSRPKGDQRDLYDPDDEDDDMSSLGAPESEVHGVTPRYSAVPGLWAAEMRELLSKKFGREYSQSKSLEVVTACSGTGAPCLALEA